MDARRCSASTRRSPHCLARSSAGRCLVRSWKGELDLELATFDNGRRLEPTARFKALRETALATGARLMVLDNTCHLFGGDENVKREVAAFVNLLNGLAAEIDGVVLLLAHPNKTLLNNPAAGDANQFGGSVAWKTRCAPACSWPRRTAMIPTHASLPTPRPTTPARGSNKLSFRWHRGAFVREEDLPADYAAELTATIRDSVDNEVFVRCLRLRNEQQRPVSNSLASRTYAPRVFAEMAESKKVGFGRWRLHWSGFSGLAGSSVEWSAARAGRTGRDWSRGALTCALTPRRQSAPTCANKSRRVRPHTP